MGTPYPRWVFDIHRNFKVIAKSALEETLYTGIQMNEDGTPAEKIPPAEAEPPAPPATDGQTVTVSIIPTTITGINTPVHFPGTITTPVTFPATGTSIQTTALQTSAPSADDDPLGIFGPANK